MTPEELAKRLGGTPAEAAEFLDDIQKRMERDRYGPPESQKLVTNEGIMRALWDRIYIQPHGHTFHDWIIAVLIDTFGEGWIDRQYQQPSDQQHCVARWLASYETEVGSPSPVPNTELSGSSKSLLVLADDIYRVRYSGPVPSGFRRRLRDTDQFQGARHELAAAATMIRAGFRITWKEPDGSRISEFAAEHKTFGTLFEVEAKSKHRDNVLHYKNPLARPQDVAKDVRGLLIEAMKKEVGATPFVVFIDLNLPMEAIAEGEEASWFLPAAEGLRRTLLIDNPATPPVAVFLTNFSWHYQGHQTAVDHYDLLVVPPSANVLSDDDRRALSLLRRRVREYGTISQNE